MLLVLGRLWFFRWDLSSDLQEIPVEFSSFTSHVQVDHVLMSKG